MQRLFQLYLILTFLALGCSPSGGDNFAGLEEQVYTENPLEAVEIDNYSPSDDPIVIANGQTKTLAVSLGAGTGAPITYKFTLDDTTVLQNSTSAFYNLQGTSLTSGTHTIKVVVSNGQSIDNHTFNIRKNTAPSISSFSPSGLAQTVSCGSAGLSFQATASDIDADGLSFSWELNGSPGSAFISSTSSASQSDATFAPNCTISGSMTLGVRVSDGNDTDTQTWNVVVTNPSIATIDTYSPTVTPVILLSTSSQLFSVGASGKAPLTYVWELDGVGVGANQSSYEVTATSLPPGSHTLDITVSDSDSTDTFTFNIIQNAPPSIDAHSPSVTSGKMNYSTTKTYTVNATDANSDGLTYTWTLDGLPSALLTSGPTVNGSQAVFSPNITILGTHEIKVIVSDGRETDQQSWTIDVNKFSSYCNNLLAGQVCTVVGMAGLGSGRYPASDNNIIQNPNSMAIDELGNYFISDYDSDVIWYWNRTANQVTRVGLTFEPGQMKVILGNGASGSTPDALYNTSFKLFSPRGMVWDTTSNALFVADTGNHRIVRLENNGQARRVAFDSAVGTSSAAAYHTDGASATSQACDQPYDLALDSVRRYLYVSCNNLSLIKRIDISNADFNNWTTKIIIGRKNATNVPQEGDTHADIGLSTTSSAIRGPTVLALSNSGNLLWWMEDENSCDLKVANLTTINGSSSDISTMNGLNVLANTSRDISGNGCNNSSGGTRTGGVLYQGSVGLALHEVAGQVVGAFISSATRHRVFYLNRQGVQVTIGGQSINDDTAYSVMGNGTLGYNGNNNSGKNTWVNVPTALILSGTSLIIGDYNNAAIRSLNISQNDPNPSNLYKLRTLFEYAGDGGPPNDAILNKPSHLAFNSINNEMYFSDTWNGKIRKINTITGSLNFVMGQHGNTQSEEVIPEDAYLYYPHGITFYGDGIVVQSKNRDYTSVYGPDNNANRNTQTKVFNTAASELTYFGSTVSGQRVTTVVGNYLVGSGTWNSLWEDSNATNVRLSSPEGIATDGSSLFIVNMEEHCILEVNNLGKISTFLGTCGSSGSSDGIIGDVGIRLNQPSAIMMDPQESGDGNLFFIDQTEGASSKIKYVNRSPTDTITIAGTNVTPNTVQAVFDIGKFAYGMATFNDIICFSSGHDRDGNQGYHNVKCFDRNDALGAITFRVGSTDASTDHGGKQLNIEDEAKAATSIKLNSPFGLAFDQEGNLWIAEYWGNTIRMVKRWF